MLKPTRRIVTGVDTKNNSTIVSDELIKAFAPYASYPCFQIQELFYTQDNPQSLQTRPATKPYTIDLPVGAMRFMIVRMPTTKEMATELKQAGQAVPDDWKKFNLHNTDSVDYIYILSGKISLIVDDEVVTLKTGDFITQIATTHTWVNDNDEPCYFLCAMVGIKPSEKRGKMVVE